MPSSRHAVARDHPRAVIDQLLAVVAAQYAFGDRHADAVGHTLTERAGGDFDRRRQAGSGWPGVRECGFAKRAKVVGRTS
jgi:hypothetical protein